MKVIISLLLSLTIFFTLAFLNQWIINKGSEELLQQALKIQEAVYDENWELAKKETEEIKKLWTDYKKTWLILMDHQEIDNIDLCIYSIDEMVNIQEKSDALESISAFRFHVRDVVDKERLELGNIF